MHADAILSGCEWVDYMYQWDKLQLAHFSIDMDAIQPRDGARPISTEGPLRVFHAPNHKSLKGTQHLLRAVERINSDGVEIELVLLRGVPNAEIIAAIESVDLVADQFVIGWYAMFALEAMCLNKPVLCYLRDDLIELYRRAGLIEDDEIPLISSDALHIEETLRWCCENREALRARGERGRAYVQKHHSLDAIGRDFGEVLTGLEVSPR